MPVTIKNLLNKSYTQRISRSPLEVFWGSGRKRSSSYSLSAVALAKVDAHQPTLFRASVDLRGNTKIRQHGHLKGEEYMTEPTALWQTDIQVNAQHVLDYIDLFDGLVLSSRCFESIDPNYWTISLFTATPLSHELVSERLKSVVPAFSETAPTEESFDIQTFSVDQQDWVTESQKQFTFIEAGYFYIYPSWHIPPMDVTGKYLIQITPSQAFGTGTHETTRGCLLALSYLYDQGFVPNHILDMGTGSGILAIAAAHLWPHASVLAVDNDPLAVQIAAENAIQNPVSSSVIQSLEACSYTDPRIMKLAPFDLVIANILAGPLMDMAVDIPHILAVKPYIMLSGFYDWQAEDVINAYHPVTPVNYYQHTTHQWQTAILSSDL